MKQKTFKDVYKKALKRFDSFGFEEQSGDAATFDRKVAFENLEKQILSAIEYFINEHKQKPTTMKNKVEFGDVVRAKCSAPARAISSTKCLFVSSMCNDLGIDNIDFDVSWDSNNLPLPSDKDLKNYRTKQLNTMHLQIEEIETNVLRWATDKSLITPDNALKQFAKTVEELGETARALLKADKDGIKDGIGDVLVTLAIFAATQGLDLQTCFAAAWQEIKDRKGSTVGGIFIKE